MSKNISTATLSANAEKTYGIDEFRSMVNYVNPKNKGYVRFAMNGDGKLSIQKFNNKIDVPLSWRSNVKPAHNQAVREALERSMASYTKFLDAETKGKINGLILNPVVGDKADKGKALSRVELKKIFDKFDSSFNTVTGRCQILDKVISDAMVKSGYRGTDQEEFMREYLRCDEHGLSKARRLDFTRMKDDKDLTAEQVKAGGVEKLQKHEKMFKSEKDFLALLVEIDNLTEAAKMRATMVNSCKGIARALVDNPGAYADPAKNNAHVGEIRAALSNLMREEGIEDVKLADIGGNGSGLETFIGTVLPAMIRQAVDNVFDLANLKDEASVESALDSTLNVDSIFNTFKEFMKGAHDAVNKVKEEDGNNLATGLMAKFDKVRSMYCELQVRNVAAIASQTIQFRERGVATKLVNDIRTQLTMPLVKEIALENYAIDFVAKTFGKTVPNKEKVAVDGHGIPLDEGIVKKAEEAVTNIKIAAQLVWGVSTDKSANVEVKHGRLMYAESINKYLDVMENKAAELANEVKGGLPLYRRLISGPVANAINAKIANVKAGGIGEKLNIDEKSYQAGFDQMKAARDAWKMFMDDKVDAIVGKARSGFMSHVSYLVKKGNISEEDRIKLLADFNTRMRDAVKTAVDRFFREKTPLPLVGDKPEDIAKNGADILTKLFEEERGNVMNDMKERIAIMAATNKVPYTFRKALFDVPARLKTCRDALDKAGVVVKGDIDDATINTTLSKLWYTVLADKFAGKKVNYDKVNKGFVDGLESDFLSRAKKFIKAYNKAADKIDAKVDEVALGGIRDELFGHREFANYKEELPEKEFDAMCKSMAVDLKLARKPMVDEMKRNFFEHPGAYGKGDVTEDFIATQMFVNFGEDFKRSEKNRYMVYSQIVTNRGRAVAGWMANPSGGANKTTLEADLVANFGRRLTQVNMIDGKDGTKVVDPKNNNTAIVEAAKDLTPAERSNIVNTAVNEVLDAAETYALSYASGGREAFLARVEREVRERVDSRIKEYSKFRREFMALAKPIMEKYSAFGEDILKRKLDSVLLQQSTQKTFPKAKSFAVAFDGMLNKALNEKIAMKEEEFVVYWKKIEKIYDKCVNAFNNKVKEMEQTLRDAGATDGDIDYLHKTLMPAMRSQLDADIQQKPESYARVRDGNDFGILIAEAKADELVTSMKTALENIQITQRDGLTRTLFDIGLREFAADDESIGVTNEAIATWMKGEKTAKILEDARRGTMLLAAFGATATGTLVDEAKKNVQTFKDELKALLLGMRATVLEGEFKTEQVEPAVKLFKIWLAQYNLPKLTVVSKDYGTGTIEQLASEHFRHHIADMQKELAERTMKGENPPEDGGEALLSAKYVTSLVQFINEIGVKAFIAEKQSSIIKARRDEIINRPENKGVYEVEDPPADLPYESMNIRQMNNYVLMTHLDYILDEATEELRSKINTMEDLARWSTDIETEFKTAYEDNEYMFDYFTDFAMRRVKLMEQIDDAASNEQVDILVRDALKEQFGADILAPGALTEKFMKKHGAEFNKFVEGVKTECYKKIAERVELMKRIANSAPQPGQATTALPINGIRNEKGGVFNQLTRNLFCTVKSHIEAESMSKDKATKKMFKNIQSSIVKVEDKKVK